MDFSIPNMCILSRFRNFAFNLFCPILAKEAWNDNFTVFA